MGLLSCGSLRPSSRIWCSVNQNTTGLQVDEECPLGPYAYRIQRNDMLGKTNKKTLTLTLTRILFQTRVCWDYRLSKSIRVCLKKIKWGKWGNVPFVTGGIRVGGGGEGSCYNCCMCRRNCLWKCECRWGGGRCEHLSLIQPVHLSDGLLHHNNMHMFKYFLLRRRIYMFNITFTMKWIKEEKRICCLRLNSRERSWKDKKYSPNKIPALRTIHIHQRQDCEEHWLISITYFTFKPLWELDLYQRP